MAEFGYGDPGPLTFRGRTRSRNPVSTLPLAVTPEENFPMPLESDEAVAPETPARAQVIDVTVQPDNIVYNNPILEVTDPATNVKLFYGVHVTTPSTMATITVTEPQVVATQTSTTIVPTIPQPAAVPTTSGCNTALTLTTSPPGPGMVSTTTTVGSPTTLVASTAVLATSQVMISSATPVLVPISAAIASTTTVASTMSMAPLMSFLPVSTSPMHSSLYSGVPPANPFVADLRFDCLESKVRLLQTQMDNNACMMTALTQTQDEMVMTQSDLATNLAEVRIDVTDLNKDYKKAVAGLEQTLAQQSEDATQAIVQLSNEMSEMSQALEDMGNVSKEQTEMLGDKVDAAREDLLSQFTSVLKSQFEQRPQSHDATNVAEKPPAIHNRPPVRGSLSGFAKDTPISKEVRRMSCDQEVVPSILRGSADLVDSGDDGSWCDDSICTDIIGDQVPKQTRKIHTKLRSRLSPMPEASTAKSIHGKPDRMTKSLNVGDTTVKSTWQRRRLSDASDDGRRSDREEYESCRRDARRDDNSDRCDPESMERNHREEPSEVRRESFAERVRTSGRGDNVAFTEAATSLGQPASAEFRFMADALGTLANTQTSWMQMMTQNQQTGTSQQQIRLPEISISNGRDVENMSCYYGNIDFGYWYQEFMRNCLYDGVVTDEKKANKLRGKLRGAAHTHMVQRSMAIHPREMTLSEVKRELKERFDVVKTPDEHIAHFHTMVQRQENTAQDFFDRLQLYWQRHIKGCRGITTDGAEEFLENQFWHGLHANLKLALSSMKKNLTLEGLVAAAKEAEISIYGPGYRGHYEPAKTSNQVVRRPGNNNNNRPKNPIPNVPAAPVNQNQNANQQNRPQNEQTPSGANNNGNTRKASNYKWNDKGQPICNRCGEAGHMGRQCQGNGNTGPMGSGTGAQGPNPSGPSRGQPGFFASAVNQYKEILKKNRGKFKDGTTFRVAITNNKKASDLICGTCGGIGHTYLLCDQESSAGGENSGPNTKGPGNHPKGATVTVGPTAVFADMGDGFEMEETNPKTLAPSHQ